MIITDSVVVGGAGVPPSGLLKVGELFQYSNNDTKKILITLSDGKQHIEQKCVRDISEQLQAEGVEMFSLGELLYDSLSGHRRSEFIMGI